MHDRQKDFPWFKQQEIQLIGAGGINSWVGILLSRIGHELHVFDHDSFEVHNIGGQYMMSNQVGFNKATALRTNIQELNNQYVRVNTFGKFEKDSFVMPYMFLGVDNMETRKLAIQKWYDIYKDTPDKILIDGRLEGEQGIIYTLRTKEDYDRWMDEFFEDSQDDEGLCTMRATSYNGAMIAANMVAVFNNYIANKLTDTDIRVIPYKIEYGFPGFVYDIQT